MKYPKFENRTYLNEVCAVNFHYGAFLGEVVSVNILNEEKGITMTIKTIPCVSSDDFSRELSETEWEDMLDILFQELSVPDWEEHYDRLGVLDGVDWTLEMVLTDGSICRCSGSNEFPPNWEGLADLFTPYLREADVAVKLYQES